MSIELMKRALEFITGVYFGEHEGSRADREKLEADLTTAIQQAEAQQPATPEPAGYLYDFKYDDEIVRDWFTQNIDEIQFRPATCLNIRPLYAHPAPSVPDDVSRNAERWRHAIADGENQSMNFLDIFDDWDGDGDFVEAFDAAMLAAK